LDVPSCKNAITKHEVKPLALAMGGSQQIVFVSVDK
jgi:hypothetical protein